MRLFYTWLLYMHPPSFRRRFAAEMLYIFDETAHSTGPFGLVRDCVASLLRQWILRSGSWKVAAAAIGACIQITAGGLIWIAVGRPGAFHKTAPVTDPATLDGLMRLIVGSSLGIVLLVTTAALWIRKFAWTRSRLLRLGR